MLSRMRFSSAVVVTVLTLVVCLVAVNADQKVSLSNLRKDRASSSKRTGAERSQPAANETDASRSGSLYSVEETHNERALNIGETKSATKSRERSLLPTFDCRCEYPAETLYSIGKRKGEYIKVKRRQTYLYTLGYTSVEDQRTLNNTCGDLTILNTTVVLPPVHPSCIDVKFVCPGTKMFAPVWTYHCSNIDCEFDNYNRVPQDAHDRSFPKKASKSGHIVTLPLDHPRCAKNNPVATTTNTVSSPVSTDVPVSVPSRSPQSLLITVAPERQSNALLSLEDRIDLDQSSSATKISSLPVVPFPSSSPGLIMLENRNDATLTPSIATRIAPVDSLSTVTQQCDGLDYSSCLISGSPDLQGIPSGCQEASILPGCNGSQQTWSTSLLLSEFNEFSKETDLAYNITQPGGGVIEHVTVSWSGNCCVRDASFFGSTLDFGLDITTCTYGVKYDAPFRLSAVSGVYKIVFAGNVPIVDDAATISIRSTNGYCTYQLPGPDCSQCSASAASDSSPPPTIAAAALPQIPSSDPSEASFPNTPQLGVSSKSWVPSGVPSSLPSLSMAPTALKLTTTGTTAPNTTPAASPSETDFPSISQSQRPDEEQSGPPSIVVTTTSPNPTITTSKAPSTLSSALPSMTNFPTYPPSGMMNGSLFPSGMPSISSRPSVALTLLSPTIITPTVPSKISSVLPSATNLPSSPPSGVLTQLPSGTPSISSRFSAVPTLLSPAIITSTAPSDISSVLPSATKVPSSPPSDALIRSQVPSGMPSSRFSTSPTLLNPTIITSTAPSRISNVIPSETNPPTFQQSQSPSKSQISSDAPSSRPSLSTTLSSPSPSITTSAAPSKISSASPSLPLFPSVLPSETPSKSQKPSDKPSFLPSLTTSPSIVPSGLPTTIFPSSSPSGIPTSAPSGIPTSAPSEEPTKEPLGSITGTVSADNNADGIIDEALRMVVITLFSRSSTGIDTFERRTATNIEGRYIFNDIPAGTYVVNETNPASFPFDVNDADGGIALSSIVVNLGPGEQSIGNDFIDQPSRRVRGAVLLSTDDDLAGEEPVGNVIMSIINTAGLVDTTLTNSMGEFEFNVPPGRYTIVETTPQGLLDVIDSDGGDPNRIAIDVRSRESLNNIFVDERPRTFPVSEPPMPTRSPSVRPTTRPPAIPTGKPTTTPTASPNAITTTTPTRRDDSGPSTTTTVRPTVKPTSRPSTIPSFTPSVFTRSPQSFAPSKLSRTPSPNMPFPSLLLPDTLSPSTQFPSEATSLSPSTLLPSEPLQTTLSPSEPLPASLLPSMIFSSEPSQATLSPSEALLTTSSPSTLSPSERMPPTLSPSEALLNTLSPSTLSPSEQMPPTLSPSETFPTTLSPSALPPSVALPTTLSPSEVLLTTLSPSTLSPSEQIPPTLSPSEQLPITLSPSTQTQTHPAATLHPSVMRPFFEFTTGPCCILVPDSDVCGLIPFCNDSPSNCLSCDGIWSSRQNGSSDPWTEPPTTQDNTETTPSVAPITTNYPTKYPTKAPFRFPTKSPIKYPTKSPATYPTKSPATYPVKYPTKSPATYPVKYPTKSPATYPVKYPTKSPATYPVKYPTKSPATYPVKYATKSPVKSYIRSTEDCWKGELWICVYESSDD